MSTPKNYVLRFLSEEAIAAAEDKIRQDLPETITVESKDQPVFYALDDLGLYAWFEVLTSSAELPPTERTYEVSKRIDLPRSDRIRLIALERDIAEYRNYDSPERLAELAETE